jgi:regulator of cell morphogenesis and NO signaling
MHRADGGADKETTMIDANQTLGQIATAHPASTLVFLRHRLDFCCGGGKKLGDACRAVGLDPKSVCAEIVAEGATRSPERWDTKPLPDLIDFIIARYHEPLRADLPALIDAARRVERVHTKKASCPHGLTADLEQLDAEVRQHLAKEEEVLFPAIVAGRGGAQVHMPVRVLMQEHDDHGASLQRLRELATDFTPPPEACATWRALYAGLEKLEAELMEHIHLENNVLFPRALNG